MRSHFIALFVVSDLGRHSIYLSRCRQGLAANPHERNTSEYWRAGRNSSRSASGCAADLGSLVPLGVNCITYFSRRKDYCASRQNGRPQCADRVHGNRGGPQSSQGSGFVACLRAQSPSHCWPSRPAGTRVSALTKTGRALRVGRPLPQARILRIRAPGTSFRFGRFAAA